MSAYAEASKAVFDVFEQTSPKVEGLSIDEAFLDVRGLERISGSASEIGARLRHQIRERVGLPSTDGVASTNSLATVASGVADPSGIFMTFVDSQYRDMLRLDSVTCVVDADQVFTYDEPELARLKLQQIGFSDLVIMNKVDLAGVEGSAKVKRWIDHHFARVRVVPAINCEVPLDILLSVGRFDQTAAMKGAKHNHDLSTVRLRKALREVLVDTRQLRAVGHAIAETDDEDIVALIGFER